jgi:glycosyltransferase involved in cell wall biosynthesis
MQKNGHEITIITRCTGLTEEFDSFEGMHIIRGPFLPTYPLHISTHGIWTNNLIKGMANEFDVIHYHIPLVPKLKTHAPSVVTVHSSMIEEMKQMEATFVLKKFALQGMTTTFTKHYMNEILTNADSIIAVSSSVREELVKYYGIESKVSVIWNGVDTTLFIPSASNNQREYILYTGRLAYRKGLLELIDAFRTISERSECDLVLSGRGPLKELLEKRVKEYGLVDRVRFTGFVTRDELVRLYQGARIFVAASAYETGPLTALEAMSCAIPIVVTRVGILPDVVEDGVTGLFVNTNDSKDIAEKCLFLLSDKERSNVIGRNARAFVERNCTWSKVAGDVANIYSSLTGSQSN